MVGGDELLPRQPNKTLSLDAFVKPAEPVRGVKPSDSADESLFGKFVKARHLDLVEELQKPSRPVGLKRSSSASKLAKLKHRQRPSPAASPAPTRPSSMRSIKSRPESPALSTSSPVQSTHSSVRSAKSRSRSPAVRKEDLATKSPGSTTSPRGTMPKLPKSPRTTVHPGGRGKTKSPRIPQKSATGGINTHGIAPCPTLDESERIPDLVDDSVVRETMEGQRGRTRWNIMEDTPAGHAEEKMAMVQAIENDDQSTDWKADDLDCLEEDDDIIDDVDEHSLVIARARRRNSLPTDPSSAYDYMQAQGDMARNDRFAPGFNNHNMWSGGGALDSHLPVVHRCVSTDASLLSDDLMSLGDVGDLTLRDSMHDHVLTPIEILSRGGGGAAETTPTVRQSGGHGTNKIDHVPSLDSDSSKKDTVDGESRSDIASGKDNYAETNARRKLAGKKKMIVTQDQEKKGSQSTGRSSQRHSTQKPRKERDALHSRRPRKIPDVVPVSLGNEIRSPSTLTSTPVSIVSSMRSQSLPVPRQRHTKSSPNQSKPRPLNLHVESGNGRSAITDDDETLGASTITTNFSTTQRTTSDKTVSTRSLFQQNSMHSSQIPRPPQRRSELCDFEDSDPDGKKPPQQPKRSQDDYKPECKEPSASDITAEDLFMGKVSVTKPLGTTQKLFSSVLRRPSGEGDDLLEMIESIHMPDETEHSEDFSLEGSGAFSLKDQSYDDDKIKDSPPSKSPRGKPRAQSFLQLNPIAPSIVMESEVPIVLPVDTSGKSKQSPDVAGDTLNGQQRQIEPSKDGVIPIISERIYDGVGHSSVSPSDSAKKNKKKSKLSLFKRVTSWKGPVPLNDDSDR